MLTETLCFVFFSDLHEAVVLPERESDRPRQAVVEGAMPHVPADRAQVL
jgi:hypothetical protein